MTLLGSDRDAVRSEDASKIPPLDVQYNLLSPLSFSRNDRAISSVCAEMRIAMPVMLYFYVNLLGFSPLPAIAKTMPATCCARSARARTPSQSKCRRMAETLALTICQFPRRSFRVHPDTIFSPTRPHETPSLLETLHDTFDGTLHPFRFRDSPLGIARFESIAISDVDFHESIRQVGVCCVPVCG